MRAHGSHRKGRAVANRDACGNGIARDGLVIVVCIRNIHQLNMVVINAVKRALGIRMVASCAQHRKRGSKLCDTHERFHLELAVGLKADDSVVCRVAQRLDDVAR